MSTGEGGQPPSMEAVDEHFELDILIMDARLTRDRQWWSLEISNYVFEV